jgi:hypothetical protein
LKRKPCDVYVHIKFRKLSAAASKKVRITASQSSLITSL